MRDNRGHFAGLGQDGIGVVNMTYRGHKYQLKEGVVSFNLSKNPGVRAPQQYVDGVIQLNFDQESEMEPMTVKGTLTSTSQA